MKTINRVVLLLVLLTSIIPVSSQISPNLVELEVYEDGWVNLSFEVGFSDPELVVYLPLYASPTFLVVFDEEGLPLNASVVGELIEVQLLGAKEVKVSYFTQDLVEKKGAVWTVNLSAIPVRVLLTLPKNARIVGLSHVPETIITGKEEEGIKVLMPPEATWVSYVQTYPSAIEGEQGRNWLKFLWFLLPIGLVLSVFLALLLRGGREKKKLDQVDKKILKELSSGGLYLKELAQKIGRSKTTAWRRCRTLERVGLLKVIKRPDGNFIKLTSSGQALAKRLEGSSG